MAITWILVANASLAKLYANLGPKTGLKLIKELAHPESRQKNADLVSDRPGSQGSNGSGGGTMRPQTEPKQHEAQVFAQEIAQTLYQGRATNAFKHAILVAPPAFMGLLNHVIDAPTAQLVSARFEKDYTRTPEPELGERIGSAILL